MPRVLIVDPDTAQAGRVRDELVGAGHEVLQAQGLADALAYTIGGGIDLVVADVSPSAGSATELAKKVRTVMAPYPVPFIFLTSEFGRDVPVLKELAESGSLFLFTKPARTFELTQTIIALLGSVRSEEGEFTDNTLDRLFARIMSDGESGVLTCFRGTIAKKAVFHDGALTFCASNDPMELIGQTFIKAGLIEEADLQKAMEVQAQNAEPLAKVLQAMAKVTAEQAETTLKRRTREAVLELYLWNQGKWIYYGGGAPVVDHAERFQVDLVSLRAEGVKRRKRWQALIQTFPRDDISFTVATTPLDYPKKPGDDKLLDLARSGRSLGEIRFELRGQDFAVLNRFGELKELDVIGLVIPPFTAATDDPDQPAEPNTAIRLLLDEADQGLDTGDVQGARRAYLDILKIDPANAAARRHLAELDLDQTSGAKQIGLTHHRVVRLKVPLEQLKELFAKWQRPGDAFVLSRLAAGEMKIKALLDVCPVTESELMTILSRCLKEKVIELD